MQALSTAKSGERYTIKWMLGNQQVMDFLHRHDFCEGNAVDVIQQNNDWMIIGMMDADLQSDARLQTGSRCKRK